MAEPYLAQIKLFAGNFAPRGWAFCDGQLLPIGANQALFSLIGTLYGGDGRTTFALPDLRGRNARHVGGVPGHSGGSVSHTLNADQLAHHGHVFYAESANADKGGPGPGSGRLLGTGTTIYAEASQANTNRALSDQAIGSAGRTNPESVNHQDPWIAINYIIALQGLFPSRN